VTTLLTLPAVRYLLRGYLRTRLRKLEMHVMAVLDDEDASQRLSEKELAYAGQYLRLFAGHMNSSLMEHLPE
jgi:GINS complex subunit 4